MVMAFTTSNAQSHFKQEVIKHSLGYDNRSANKLHSVNIDYVNNNDGNGLDLNDINVISFDHQKKTIEVEGYKTFTLGIGSARKSRTIKFNVKYAARDGRVLITMTSPLFWDDSLTYDENKIMNDNIKSTIDSEIMIYEFNTRPDKDNGW